MRLNYLVPAAVARTLIDSQIGAHSATPCPNPAWSLVVVWSFVSGEKRRLFEDAPGVIELVPWEPTPPDLLAAFGTEAAAYNLTATDSTHRSLKKLSRAYRDLDV
jgi:hypothetical protein